MQDLRRHLHLRQSRYPNCGSVDVQLALGIEELPDDNPLIEAMTRLARDDANED